MKNTFEQWKKMYIMFIDVLIVVLPTFFFWLVWSREINELLYVDFKNKGNWLIILCYMIILTLMFYAFRGFKIGYYKISSVIISQFFSIVCTQLILTIQIILMTGQVLVIGRVVASMLWLMVVNIMSVIIITIMFTKLYNRIWPPYRLLHIYGDYKNNLKKKIATRADKYVIEKDIYFGESIENIKKEILKYDGVVLNDIPSDKKNVLLKYCFDNRVRVYFVPKITDIFVKASEEINIFDTPIFLCKNMGLTIDQKVMKRTVDILISGVILIITAPIMGIVALAVKLEDHGPVIYSQERCTLDGEHFMLHKFRSMKVGAEENGGAQLAKKCDERITKVGKIIRATRLDELPQLVNVLKGEMSFVGPRPERPEFVEKNCKEIPEFQYRMKVKAGLTGYAQVFGKYNTSFLDKLKLDLLYIEKYSILLDIQIILMTLKVIFMKESAEGLEE